MKKIILLFIGICFLVNPAEAQKDSIIFVNSRKIDKKRYLEIKGSPFYFTNFTRGNIISKDFEIFEDILLNYNGHTQDFEARRGDEFIQLDRNQYIRIEIFADKNKDNPEVKAENKLIFQQGLHGRFLHVFVELLYQGKNLNLIKDFTVSLSENTVQDVGKSVRFQRFHPKTSYYLLINGEAKLLKFKRKRLLDILGYKKEIEKFLDEEKLKVNSEESLVKIIKYYDSIVE